MKKGLINSQKIHFLLAYYTDPKQGCTQELTVLILKKQGLQEGLT